MPTALTGKIGSRRLTDELKRLAAEMISVDDDGNPITREQALAAMIWKQALGWTEKTRDDEGREVEVVHKPVAWAQTFLFERTEGKAAQATPDTEGGIKAADKVRELAKDRINKISAIVTGPPSKKQRKEEVK